MEETQIISLLDDNQSTVTIDTSTNPAKRGLVSGATQYDNVNPERGWDIVANLNSMNDVERTQCQFGYFNNDEFSFNDTSGMLYFNVLLWNDLGTRYLSMGLCTKLPKVPWSIFGLAKETAGWEWHELTDGEAARNAQQSLAKVICYYMNNRAVETCRAAAATTIGVDWKNAAYVDAEGNVGTYAANFVASGLTFMTGGAATSAITQNFIAVATNAGWNARVYFMDGENGVYNTVGGAFSSGMGTYTRGRPVTKITFDTFTAGGGVETETVVQPYPYLFNEESPNVACYFPTGGSENQTVYEPGAAKITFPEFQARAAQLEALLGRGLILPFARSTTLLNSKYYVAFCDELYEGATVSHMANARFPSQVMGVLESTIEKRNEWGEYDSGSVHPVQQMSNSVRQLNYQFRNDQTQSMVCMSNVAFPSATVTIPTFVSGDLAHLPDYDWVGLYFDAGSRVNLYPIYTSGATLPGDTFVAAFQTARRPG